MNGVVYQSAIVPTSTPQLYYLHNFNHNYNFNCYGVMMMKQDGENTLNKIHHKC